MSELSPCPLQITKCHLSAETADEKTDSRRARVHAAGFTYGAAKRRRLYCTLRLTGVDREAGFCVMGWRPPEDCSRLDRKKPAGGVCTQPPAWLLGKDVASGFNIPPKDRVSGRALRPAGAGREVGPQSPALPQPTSGWGVGGTKLPSPGITECRVPSRPSTLL